jgi:hypothetical protein
MQPRLAQHPLLKLQQQPRFCYVHSEVLVTRHSLQHANRHLWSSCKSLRHTRTQCNHCNGRCGSSSTYRADILPPAATAFALQLPPPALPLPPALPAALPADSLRRCCSSAAAVPLRLVLLLLSAPAAVPAAAAAAAAPPWLALSSSAGVNQGSSLPTRRAAQRRRTAVRQALQATLSTLELYMYKGIGAQRLICTFLTCSASKGLQAHSCSFLPDTRPPTAPYRPPNASKACPCADKVCKDSL